MDLKSVENHIFNTTYIFNNGTIVDLINYRMVYFKLWTVQYLINTLYNTFFSGLKYLKPSKQDYQLV